MASQDRIKVELVGYRVGQVTLMVTGELNELTGDTFLELTAAHFNPERDLVLDLGSTSFLNSRGLSALVALRNRYRDAGRAVAVRGARGSVLAVIEATGLDEVLIEEGTTESAEPA